MTATTLCAFFVMMMLSEPSAPLRFQTEWHKPPTLGYCVNSGALPVRKEREA